MTDRPGPTVEPAGPSLATPGRQPAELFFEVWLKALTRPTEADYRQIIESPSAKVSRAALWLFVTSLFGSGIAAIFSVSDWSATLSELGDSSDLGAFAGAGALLLLCALPIQAGIQVLWSLFYTGILQFVASALGGDGRYHQLYYGRMSFTAPLTLVTGLLAVIPYAGLCLTIPVFFYLLYLNALTVKTAHRIGWGRAIVTLLVPALVLTSLIVIIVLGLLLPVIEGINSGGPVNF